MKTVNISEFRANLLQYLDSVNSGEPFCVTSNGKALATISPPVNQKELARKQLLSLAKKAKVKDVISPVDEQWEAVS